MHAAPRSTLVALTLGAIAGGILATYTVAAAAPEQAGAAGTLMAQVRTPSSPTVPASPPGSSGPAQPSGVQQAPGTPNKGAPGAKAAGKSQPEVATPPDASASAGCQRIANAGERDACTRRIPGTVGGVAR